MHRLELKFSNGPPIPKLQGGLEGENEAMRIDPNQRAQSPTESSRSVQPQPSPASAGSGSPVGGSALGEDQAQLSGVHFQVQALTAQALQFPEVRQEKVNALRQVVAEGTYQPASKQVADALFSHILAAAAA